MLASYLPLPAKTTGATITFRALARIKHFRNLTSSNSSEIYGGKSTKGLSYIFLFCVACFSSPPRKDLTKNARAQGVPKVPSPVCACPVLTHPRTTMGKYWFERLPSFLAENSVFPTVFTVTHVEVMQPSFACITVHTHTVVGESGCISQRKQGNYIDTALFIHRADSKCFTYDKMK
jgi:hypothetical protein